MIDVRPISFKDEQNNVGAAALVGPTSKRVTATLQFYVHWEAENIPMTFSGNEITRDDLGSWLVDDFNDGDTIEVVGTTSNDGIYNVIGIPTVDKLVCSMVGSGSGSGSPSGIFVTETVVSASVYGTTPIKRLRFKYNTIENSVAATFLATIDGNERAFITPSNNDFDSTATVSLTPVGLINSHITGFTADLAANQVEFLGVGASGISTGFEQYFEATFIFYTDPVLLETFLDANGLIDNSLITEFYQSACVRFVHSWEGSFDSVTYPHNTDNGNIDNTIQGDTGVWNEYRNGGTPDYSLTSITLTDPYGESVSNLGSNSDTSVVVVLADSGAAFSATTYFVVSLWEMPDEVDYQNTTTKMFDNFDVSRVRINEGSAATSHNNLTDVEVVALAGVATLTLTVDAKAANEGRKYILLVETQTDTSVDMNTTNNMVVLGHQGFRTDNIPLDDVLESEKGVLFNDHSSNNPDIGNSDYKGWVEDDILISFDFSLRRKTQDNRSVVIQGATVRAMCQHISDPSKDFQLDSAPLTLNATLSRGYTFSGKKNEATFTELSLDATKRYYSIQVGQMLGYEDFQSEPNANSDFPNATKNWSDFEDDPDYSIKVFIEIETKIGEDDDVTFRRIASVEDKNYEEYYDCPIIGEIQTSYHLIGTDLNGSISKTQNSKVKGIFYGKELFPCVYVDGSGSGSCSFSQILSGSGSLSYSEVPAAECFNFWGWLGLDNEVNGGRLVIDILSTEDDKEPTSAWIGLNGDRAKLLQFPYAANPRVEISGVLDAGLLDTSLVSQKLTARLGKKNTQLCTTSIVTTLESQQTYQNNELVDKQEEEIMAFNAGNEVLSSTSTFDPVTGTITFPDFFSGLLKICCTIMGWIDTVTASDKYTDSRLQGITIDDFILFYAGAEQTTTAGTSFNSGLGEFTFAGVISADIKVSLHAAIVSDTLSTQQTYQDPSLIGRSVDDILVFLNGTEYTTLASFSFDSSTGTLDFIAPVSGKMKVVEC